MKAVILERKGDEVAALCDDGTFIKIKHPGQVGEEIDILAKTIAVPHFTKRFISVAAAAVITLAAIGGGYQYNYRDVSASVYVEIGDNTVQMSVNRAGQVIGVTSVSGENDIAVRLNNELHGIKFENALERTWKVLSDDKDKTMIVNIDAKSEKQAQKLENAVESVNAPIIDIRVNDVQIEQENAVQTTPQKNEKESITVSETIVETVTTVEQTSADNSTEEETTTTMTEITENITEEPIETTVTTQESIPEDIGEANETVVTTVPTITEGPAQIGVTTINEPRQELIIINDVPKQSEPQITDERIEPVPHNSEDKATSPEDPNASFSENNPQLPTEPIITIDPDMGRDNTSRPPKETDKNQQPDIPQTERQDKPQGDMPQGQPQMRGGVPAPMGENQPTN